VELKRLHKMVDVKNTILKKKNQYRSKSDPYFQ